MGLIQLTKDTFNAFRAKEKKAESRRYADERSGFSSSNPFRTPRYSKGSIVDSVINRIAIDLSQLEFSHVKIDKKPTTETDMKSGLNECLHLSPNLDQTAKDFFQDVAFSMFDEGVVAIVPVITDVDPKTGAFDILSMRTGKIVQWFNQAVEVRCYDEETGNYGNLVYDKRNIAIIPNPLYEVLNANNATLTRYMHKLRLIDTVDEKTASTKLDMILQMPYSLKADMHKERAEQRRKDIEDQITNSKLGIAYIGAEEKVTQLNRSLENNLNTEVQQLREEFFNQLGISQTVFQGTASEAEMQYYYLKIVYPIADRICQEFERKFLTKTGRTQGQRIVYYSNPLKFVPASQVASMGDTFKRNMIATTNELRKIIGFRPSDDENADKLYNPNMPMDQQPGQEGGADDISDEEASSILSQLQPQQMSELVEYIKSLVGEDVPPDQITDALDDEQFKMVIQKAKEMLGQSDQSDEQQ